MTLTTKGQVTIPLAIRQKLGLLPGTRVAFDVVGNSVRIRRAGEQRRGATRHLSQA
jgi:AbrB family looped-hinge helix DNA binding protein